MTSQLYEPNSGMGRGLPVAQLILWFLVIVACGAVLSYFAPAIIALLSRNGAQIEQAATAAPFIVGVLVAVLFFMLLMAAFLISFETSRRDSRRHELASIQDRLAAARNRLHESGQQP
jgi:small-conductance mechanosensitive channel